MSVSVLLVRSCVLVACVAACGGAKTPFPARASESAFHGKMPHLPAHVDCLDPLFSTWPPVLSSPWRDAGHPFVPGFHTGIDLAVPAGTPVLAPADGMVIEVTSVRKPTDDAESTAEVVASFGVLWFYSVAHLSRIDVAPGQKIRRGHVLGLSGGAVGAAGSGPLTNGPHVHFQLSYDGKFADPRPYFCILP